MPDQPQNTIPLPAPTPTKQDTRRKPAIRTMKSDIEEMFKTTKPSLVKIVGQEVAAARPMGDRVGAKRHYATFAAGVIILAVLLGGTYIFLFREAPAVSVPPKLVTPAPFFAAETSRTISVKIQDRVQFIRLLEDSMREREREGTVKRIIIKVQEGAEERFATLADFFAFWRIAPPKNLLGQVEPPLMAFIYYGKDGSRIGLATKVRDPDRAQGEMLAWESTMLRDVQPLFFNVKPDTVLALFEDRTYRNIDWRYLKLSQEFDFGIGYATFPARNLLVIATAKEALEVAISRLFDAQ